MSLIHQTTPTAITHERTERAHHDARPGGDAGLGDLEGLVLDRFDPTLRPLVLLRQHDETGQQQQQSRTWQDERSDADQRPGANRG